MKNVREILATDEVKAFSQPLQLLETSRRGKTSSWWGFKKDRLTSEAGVFEKCQRQNWQSVIKKATPYVGSSKLIMGS